MRGAVDDKAATVKQYRVVTSSAVQSAEITKMIGDRLPLSSSVTEMQS